MGLLDIFQVEDHSINSVSYLKSLRILALYRKFVGFKNVLRERRVHAIPIHRDSLIHMYMYIESVCLCDLWVVVPNLSCGYSQHCCQQFQCPASLHCLILHVARTQTHMV